MYGSRVMVERPVPLAKFISLRQFAQALGVSMKTIARRIDSAEQGFPKPVRVGRCIRFVEDEVRSYMDRLIAEARRA